MSKLFWNVLKLSPLFLGVAFLPTNRSTALPIPPSADSGTNTAATTGFEQVTSVSEMSDVRPTDWAFEALRSLIERYGCIVGYPDRTYRGNRALSRWEFAAGLNACMNVMERLIQENVAVLSEDIDKLKRLARDFQQELTALGTRVDNLEARVSYIEDHTFSTTTKLNGDVIFVLSDVFGDQKAVPSSPTTVGGVTPAPGSAGKLDVSANLGYRVRLNFDTSFTGKDLLKTRLIAGNLPLYGPNLTGTFETRLGSDANTRNSVALSRLWYRFPVIPNGSLKIAVIDTFFEDNLFTFNPGLSPSATGSVSRFGRFNPIYRQGVNNADDSTGGAGFTFNYNVNSWLGFSAGYLVPTSTASNPAIGRGLFNGAYTALGQLLFRPNDSFNFGLTYAHSYNNPENGISVSGDTGSVFANQPFGNDVATSSNQYGLEMLWRVNDKFTISGWGGLTYATAENSSTSGATRGNGAEIFNYALAVSFPDLGKEGNLAALIFGQPPKVSSSNFGTGSERIDRDNSYHLEGIYRYRVNDNIDITPGLIVIFNPEGNSNNDTEYVGVVRTTFTF